MTITSDSDTTRPWWKVALVTVPVIVVAGNLSGLLSNSGFGNPWFDAVRKPSFMPPGWVFGVTWTILYTLMGISVARVISAVDSPPLPSSWAYPRIPPPSPLRTRR